MATKRTSTTKRRSTKSKKNNLLSLIPGLNKKRRTTKSKGIPTVEVLKLLFLASAGYVLFNTALDLVDFNRQLILEVKQERIQSIPTQLINQ